MVVNAYSHFVTAPWLNILCMLHREALPLSIDQGIFTLHIQTFLNPKLNRKEHNIPSIALAKRYKGAFGTSSLY